MTDQDLLKLAATAAGILPAPGKDIDIAPDGGLMICGGGEVLHWNPLTDDGDALRLVVALGIHLQFAMNFAVSYAGSVHAKQFTERNGDDPGAAARRAIVRAAAELGKAMP